jgi:hypothetical protein
MGAGVDTLAGKNGEKPFPWQDETAVLPGSPDIA